MKYTKSALGLLNAQYRSVLKKCLLINLGLFVLATPAMADTTVIVGGTYDSGAGTVTGGTATNLDTVYDASGAAAAVQGATTETVASVDAKVAGKVDNTTTVNGHALSSNVTLTAADVGADASGAAAAVQGATTETVASVDAKVAGKVDNTTTVNGHALSSNVTLTAADG